MKILAMEVEADGASPEQFEPHLKAEALRVWELYFRGDRSEAVLVLECAGVSEAQQALDSLPLVQAGLIHFDVIPLVPYPGFKRLFGE